MRCRSYRYHLCKHIYTDAFTLLINIRKVMQEFFLVHMTAIKVHMRCTGYLHFIIYSTGYNIAWGQVFTLIIARHKCLSMHIA
ncbi:hypothetical protein D3C72_1621410 [compost metagenome]